MQRHTKCTDATSYRTLTLDGDPIDFSDGFTDLHTKSYEEILAGGGFSISDCRPAIETVAFIRNAPLSCIADDYHPLLQGLSGKIFSA